MSIRRGLYGITVSYPGFFSLENLLFERGDGMPGLSVMHYPLVSLRILPYVQPYSCTYLVSRMPGSVVSVSLGAFKMPDIPASGNLVPGNCGTTGCIRSRVYFTWSSK